MINEPALMLATMSSAVDTGASIIGATGTTTQASIFRFDKATKKVTDSIAINSEGTRDAAQDKTSVFIASYNKPNIYRVNKIGKLTATRIVTPDSSTMQFFSLDLFAGNLFAGSYPDCKLYNLKSGPIKVSTTRTYARSVLAISDTKVLVGVGTMAGLYVVDLVARTSTEIQSSHFANESFVYSLARVNNNKAVGLLSTTGRVIEIDLSNYGVKVLDKRNDKPNPDEATVLQSYGMVSKDTSNGLYRYPYPTILALTETESGYSGLNSNAVYIEDGARYDLNAVGLPSAAVIPFSMCSYDCNVRVGHRVISNPLTRSLEIIAGEAKAMVYDKENTLWSAHYTGARVFRNNQLFYDIGAVSEQNRPTDIAVNDNFVVVATEPDYGIRGGALTVIDRETQETAQYRHKTNTMLAVALAPDGIIYGTSIFGGTGTAIDNSLIATYGATAGWYVNVTGDAVTGVSYVDKHIIATDTDGFIYASTKDRHVRKHIEAKKVINNFVLTKTGIYQFDVNLNTEQLVKDSEIIDFSVDTRAMLISYTTTKQAIFKQVSIKSVQTVTQYQIVADVVRQFNSEQKYLPQDWEASESLLDKVVQWFSNINIF